MVYDKNNSTLRTNPFCERFMSLQAQKLGNAAWFASTKTLFQK
jgi:hypothetical protein